MPEVSSYDHGVPAWVDLGSGDLAESVRFYEGLFGWEHQDMGAEAGHYTMFSLGGKTVAAVGPLMMDGQPEVWSTYVNVTNADDVATTIAAAGGLTLAPNFDVMDAGRMGVYMDPTGAAFSLWEPKSTIGAELVNEPGALCWNELNTRDIEKSKEFYSKVFGWSPQDNQMEGMAYTEWQIDGRTVGGMLPMPEMVPAEVPNHWLVYFATTDTDAMAAKVTELGGSVIAGPFDVPPGRMAVFTDPRGATFAVIAMAPQ